MERNHNSFFVFFAFFVFFVFKISSAADTAAIQRVGGVAAFSRFLEAPAVSVADFVRDPEWLLAAS